jgi:hypothetical protein
MMPTSGGTSLRASTHNWVHSARFLQDCTMVTGFEIGAKLSRGLSGRLSFDYACNRGGVFSETYFYGLMMELLASHVSPTGSVVRVGHPLDAIQHPDRAGGRFREVDFVITTREDEPEVQAAIEVKWAGSGYATGENILKDLVRLSLVRNAHPNARCFFVLAGRRRDIQALFDEELLQDNLSELAGAYQAWLAERNSVLESRGDASPQDPGFVRVPVHAPHRPPTPIRRWNARKRNNEYLLRPAKGATAQAPDSVLRTLEADYPQYPASISTAFSDVPGMLENPWPVLVWRVL